MGPYALLKPLKNGHYKRIVEAKPPQIFEQCRMCMDSSLNREEGKKFTIFVFTHFHFMTKNLPEVVEITHKDTSIYTDSSAEVFEESDNAIFYKLYTQNVEIRDSQEAEPESSEVEQQDSEVSMVDSNISSQLVQNLENSGITHESYLTRSESSIENERLSRFGNVAVDVESESLFRGEGVPTLFYTKSRVKAALLFLSIDYEMQVVYMSKKSISRFFPVKLVQRIVTSPDIIQEEFKEHLKNDPLTKLECMVLFNATNFTDAVAVQFSHEKIRDRFVQEIKNIKKLIKQY
ncbi:conserved hypothetical protein [Theileria equi strain WA]|uniref:Uncharacterized protein n=1 Tax=Theileria equi strain WA TaxID=1537102 RepID=L1LCL4_THEEQ|nr:conserved hypothetical protein [Theileria equi strain WA]EKX73177.1 conserved hypothetical protein [Theileria equi strain WA]|eukprot:XP_004832629.1 conserved hypothetical protein [Theileria equi strain WA]